MKTVIYFSVLCVPGFLFSCTSVKSSQYSAYNQFSYENEQPRFHFKNDTLKIEGAWNWGTGARAIPKISFIPKIPMQIIQSISKERGPVLFATWIPNRKKYSVAGYVPVSKKDVRFKDRNVDPFYIVVLENRKSVDIDTVRYKPQGRNGDYQFDLYASEFRPARDNYWIMEVLAAGDEHGYDFVCIIDSSFVSGPGSPGQQARVFLDDIQHRFLTQ